MTRKLLLTGASGYLGQALLENARGWEVLALSYSRRVQRPGISTEQVDLRDAEATQAMVRASKPYVIVHAAASNRNAEHIAAIVHGAQNVASAARDSGARLIHVSSDLVFDGESGPYTDETGPAPLDNPYATAKGEAEKRVARIHPQAAIVRPSLIWGLNPLDHQTQWLVEAVRKNVPVTLFTDEIRCPVYVHDLARAILELADRVDLVGPYNLVGAQPLNRWEFGLRLLRKLGLKPSPTLKPGLSRDSGLVRARDLTLRADRARHDLRTRLRGVDEVLSSLK
jgi:dTDP-4-dehydrorhamnose reductase